MATTFSGLKLTDVNTARPVYAPMLLSIPVSNGTLHLHDVAYEPPYEIVVIMLEPLFPSIFLYLLNLWKNSLHLSHLSPSLPKDRRVISADPSERWDREHHSLTLWIFRDANPVLSERGIFVRKTYGKVGRKFSMREMRAIGVQKRYEMRAFRCVAHDWKCLWQKSLLINQARIGGTLV